MVNITSDKCPNCGKTTYINWKPQVGDKCISNSEDGFNDAVGTVINVSIDRKWIQVRWESGSESWAESKYILTWTRETSHTEQVEEFSSMNANQWIRFLMDQGFTEIQINADGIIIGRKESDHGHK